MGKIHLVIQSCVDTIDEAVKICLLIQFTNTIDHNRIQNKFPNILIICNTTCWLQGNYKRLHHLIVQINWNHLSLQNINSIVYAASKEVLELVSPFFVYDFVNHHHFVVGAKTVEDVHPLRVAAY